MIKKFKQYSEESELSNESLRDKMTPVSEEDIRNSIDNIIDNMEYGLTAGSVEELAESLNQDINDVLDEIFYLIPREQQNRIIRGVIEEYLTHN